MNYHIFKLMSSTELTSVITKLMLCPDWIDGKATTSQPGHSQIKKNIQLSKCSETYEELSEHISWLIMNERRIIANYIFPKKVINILFSRSSPGMFYGEHVDAAYTPDGRRDYSFTLFLNNPKDYEGGELILNIPPEQKSIKLEAGGIVIYPTKYLHEVKEVTSGERIVCVGWIESYLKKDTERELVSSVYRAILCAQNGDSSKAVLALNLVYQRLQKYFGD